MLTRTDLRGLHGDLRAVLARHDASVVDVGPAVRDIIAAVREHGDAALFELTKRFDGAELDDLAVPVAERNAALERLDPDLVLALEFARDQILAWHEAQREREAVHERAGVHVRELVLPVDRAGCYVPGGRAAYPSTVLMTAVPARVAGVPDVGLCTPPGRDGRVSDATLAAAQIAGVDAVYRVGGVQAIAALAFGTETIAPVDVVVGPGNRFVSIAKREVAGAGVVGIDSPAGPSELVLVADAGAPPDLVAADLAAQAEHGPGGTAVLVTWDPALADAVDAALAAFVGGAARADEIRTTLDAGGHTLLVRDAEHALTVANRIAPEHLELMVAEPDALLPRVRNAGAVFCGAAAATALGDYVAGANHVLPTGRAARFASALRVDDFRRHVHVVRATPDGAAGLGAVGAVIARAEGLEAHARSLELRTRP
jgi:histidinol dehydrogenase